MKLCIPVLNRFSSLYVCVSSALSGTRRPDGIVIIDNSGGKIVEESPWIYESWFLDAGGEVLISTEGNMGVAASWNTFFEYLAPSPLIISNDDVVFYGDTLKRLMHAVENDPHSAVFHSAHAGENGFSLFHLRREVYDSVGKFDECFWPAYYEDTDYKRRLVLAGHQTCLVPDMNYDHMKEASIKSLDPMTRNEYENSIRENYHYYCSKWGGAPGHETFAVPFNGKNPSS